MNNTTIHSTIQRYLLLITCILIATAVFGQHYDFSAAAPTGQTLYYKINAGDTSVTIVNEKGTIPPASPYTIKPTGNLTIPSTVTFNENTYTVTNIGIHAFNNCKGLTGISFPNTITRIDSCAFLWCTSLTNVTIPNSVTHVGEYAFQHCENLANLTISNALTIISYCAFSICPKLTSVTIPETVTIIGEGGLWETGLTSVVIPHNVTTIDKYAFLRCKKLLSVSIPNSVTKIGEYAFQECSSLTQVCIPNSVTTIESESFSLCYNLSSVTLPNAVTSINSGAFRNCSKLTSITFPNTIVSIAGNAFNGCSSLSVVTCEATTPPTTVPTAFTKYDTLYVPCCSIMAYKDHATWGNFATILSIENAQFTVSASANEASKGNVSGSGPYHCGETVTLTATPNDGYCFIKWQDDNTDNPRTFTITQDTSFTAIFDYKRGTHTSSVCQGEAYSYKDSVFTTTTVGTFSKDVQFSNEDDCDSVVTVTLTVVAKSSTDEVMLKDTCYENGKSTMLKVESPSATATYRFYDSHHTLLHTGTEYTTDPLSANEVFYLTIQDPPLCESEEKTISVYECINNIQLHKAVDNTSVCKNNIVTITTVIDKQSPWTMHKVQLIEDFSTADFELLSAELKINGKVVPYTLDMVHKKLFFNMLELSGAGNYILTITARTTENLGPKTETATLRWANNPTGITETATFNVVD